MVWNLTQPEVKPSKKLTLQDFKVGDRVRVLEATHSVWGETGTPAGTEWEVVAVGSYWVNVKNTKQNLFSFYDLAGDAGHRLRAGARLAGHRGRALASRVLVAKRTLDNLVKVE